MHKRVEAEGQAITSSLTYTGNYDDNPKFGAVSFNKAVNLVKSLPVFTKEADEEDLCPPTIIFHDEQGNTLTIHSSPTGPGKYNAYLTPPTGDMKSVAIDAELSRIVDILSKFYSGAKIKEEKIKAEPKPPSNKLLAVIPCKTWEGAGEGFTETTIDFWETPNGYRYAKIYVDKNHYVEIPLTSITKITIKKGSFLREPSVTIEYRINNKKRKIKMTISKKWGNIIEPTIAELRKILPGKIHVK